MFLTNTVSTDFTCFRIVLDEFSSVICLLLCLYLVLWITVKICVCLYKAAFDMGATLSIVARGLLKQAKIQKAKTVAIRVGDGGTIHSLGGG